MASTAAIDTQHGATAPVTATEVTNTSHPAAVDSTTPVAQSTDPTATNTHHAAGAEPVRQSDATSVDARNLANEKSRHAHPANGAAKLPARITRILLWVSLTLLIIDAAVQIGFAGETLNWVNTLDASRRRYGITYFTSEVFLSALPVYFDNDVTRVALSAGAVALVLVGFGGILAIILRGRPGFSTSLYSKIWYHFWLVSVLLSMLLSFASIIYTFVIRNQTIGSSISLTNANRYSNAYIRYNAGYWSPITWFSELLTLRITADSNRSDIMFHWRLIVGWMYNQFPLFVLGLAVFFFAIVDAIVGRKLARQRRAETGGAAVATQ